VRVVLIQKRPKRLRGHPSWFTHSIGKNCAIIAKDGFLFFFTRKETKENRPHTKALAVRLCTTARDLAFGVV